jgi:hypothetical protein
VVPTPPSEASDILAGVCRTAVGALSADLGAVLVTDAERAGMRVAAHAGLDVKAAAALQERIGSQLVRHSARCGHVRPADTVPESHPARIVASAIGAASVLLVPLACDAGTVGVLVVGRRGARAFSDGDMTVLGLIADGAAAAMENRRLRADRVDALDLQRQNTMMRQVAEARDELVRVSLDGAGLGQLVAVLSRVLGAPLTLTSPAGTRVASAGEGAAITIGEGALAVPINAGGEILATLTVHAATPLAETDTLVLREGACLLAAEIVRERSVLDAEVRLHGGLLESLTGAVGGDPKAVETRAGLLGIDLQGAQCVVAIARSPAGEPTLPVVIAAGQRACALLGIRGVFAQRDQAIIGLLVSADRAVSREIVEEWTTAFDAQLAQRGVAAPGKVGVSAVPLEPGHIADGLEGAQQALRVGGLRDHGRLTYVQDVELFAVFADSMKQDQLKSYVEHSIGELIAYDERTNSELVRTLEAYLDSSCVARHAAAALYLHPHSLRYRLRRIEEVQGLDLQDPFARLTAHLATKVRPLLACA